MKGRFCTISRFGVKEYRSTGVETNVSPANVTSIGDDAFYGCTGLTSISIPNTITVIESNCFYGCSSLTSFIIPENVTEIKTNAFSGCSGLTSLTCKAITPPQLSGRTSPFTRVDTSIPLYVPSSSVAECQSAKGWKSFTNIIGVEAGIENAEIDERESSIIYDLNGRCVMNPQKGDIYIVNGKKVVIK